MFQQEPPGLPPDIHDLLPMAPNDPYHPRILPYIGSYVTSCRKCHWYTPLPNFIVDRTSSYYHTPASSNLMDQISTPVTRDPAYWCRSCGRMAVMMDNNNVPGTTTNQRVPTHNPCRPYHPPSNEIYLGSKTIPFTLHVHDPRQMKAFASQWATYEGTSPAWKYDEVDEEEDLFHHRLGRYPSLETILRSIPVLRDDWIPTDGHYWMWGKQQQQVETEQTNKPAWHDDDDDDEDGQEKKKKEKKAPTTKTTRAEDTDAIVLLDKKHLLLLQEIFKFRHVACPPSTYCNPSMMGGDIVAKWNREERQGVRTTIQLFSLSTVCV